MVLAIVLITGLANRLGDYLKYTSYLQHCRNCAVQQCKTDWLLELPTAKVDD